MRLTILAGMVATVGLAVAIAIAWPGGSSRAQDSAQPAGFAQSGVLAFESSRTGNADVWLLRDGQFIQVTDNPAQEGQPAFGCDDHTIYFVSNSSGNLGITLAVSEVPWDRYNEGDHVDFEELTSAPGLFDATPMVYCGITSSVFFTRQGSGGGDVWRMDLDGGNPVNLTNNPADDSSPFAYNLGLGPEVKVLFQSNRGGDYDIWSMDANGGNVESLIHSTGADYFASLGTAAYSVYFTSNRDGNDELYGWNFDTHVTTRLTNNPATDIDPQPGPNGGVFFTRIPAGGSGDIYYMNSDGTGQTPVVTSAESDSWPAWSALPDLVPPTETPDNRFHVTLSKVDADTGLGMGGWQIQVFSGGTCEGEFQNVYTTEAFGDVEFDIDPGGGPLSFREIQFPGWEQVTFVGESTCPSIDGNEDATVVFHNRRIGRRGDSNGDGQITAIDATLDLQFGAGYPVHLTGPADANRDGHVNSLDATLKLQHVAGLYVIPAS